MLLKLDFIQLKHAVRIGVNRSWISGRGVYTYGFVLSVDSRFSFRKCFVLLAGEPLIIVVEVVSSAVVEQKHPRLGSFSGGSFVPVFHFWLSRSYACNKLYKVRVL